MNVANGTGHEQPAAGAADPRACRSLEQFAELVRRYQVGVCAAAYGVTADRALSEDIAQETFVVAWRRGSTLRDPAKLRAWLGGIARNLARKANYGSGGRMARVTCGSAGSGTSPRPSIGKLTWTSTSAWAHAEARRALR